MSEPVLFLGGVQFDVIEQPDFLQIGGTQSTQVVKFPGGNINVQLLGAFEDVISWDGTFWYTGALTRALQLDKFRIDGTEVLMRWSSIVRYVAVTKFNPKIYNEEWVDYSIELTPTRSSNLLVPAAATPKNTSPSTVQAQAATTQLTVSSSGATTTAPAAQQAVTYRVQKGETLWEIAVKVYGKGNGAEYTKIAEANHLDNPNLVPTGMLLTIPK